MGGSVSPYEWIVPPLALGHLTIAEASKAVGGPSLAAPGSRLAGGGGSDPFKTAISTEKTLISGMAKPITNSPIKPGITDAERDRQARLAASKRRKDFENLGRSSTILTGPGGLGGLGTGEQKTLLGY